MMELESKTYSGHMIVVFSIYLSHDGIRSLHDIDEVARHDVRGGGTGGAGGAIAPPKLRSVGLAPPNWMAIVRPTLLL